MKRKVLVAALLVIALALVGYGTAAYFTADGTATNVITTGSISITLDETSVDETGAVSAFKDVAGVMPGAKISKIVAVTNTGLCAPDQQLRPHRRGQTRQVHPHG